MNVNNGILKSPTLVMAHGHPVPLVKILLCYCQWMNSKCFEQWFQGSHTILNINFQTFSRPFPYFFLTFSRLSFPEWPAQVKYMHTLSILNKILWKCMAKDQVWKIISFFHTNRPKIFFPGKWPIFFHTPWNPAVPNLLLPMPLLITSKILSFPHVVI